MKIRIRKSTLICIVIIIALIIAIGILAYELANTKQNNKKEDNTISTEKQELNEDELKDIEKFLNTEENNGFIQCKYNKIEDISDLQWNWILISASQKIGDTSNTAIQEYIKLKNEEVLGTPVYKYKSEDLINFLKEKTGKQYAIDNLQSILPEDIVWNENKEYCYLSTGEAGYNQVKDLSGYKQSNKYVINGKYYNLQYDDNGKKITSFTVTLQKTDTGYVFISNEIK